MRCGSMGDVYELLQSLSILPFHPIPSTDDLTDKIRSPETRIPVILMVSAEVLG